MEENARSRAFIERLLRHQAFTPFLEELSRDDDGLDVKPSVGMLSGSATPTPAPARSQQLAAISQPQVGMTMVPETPLDMSMLNLNSNWSMNNGNASFTYQQPQVFAVTELPEGPTNPLDMQVISGKGYTSIFAVEDDSPDEDVKVDHPILERALPAERSTSVEVDDDQDPEFDLYNASPVSTSSSVSTSPSEINDSLFGDIDSEKMFAHFQLQISDEVADELKMARFQRQCAKMEACLKRVQALTLHLDT